MWSKLVFPLALAHLNILISAEFSLFSSFFFTAQRSGLYVIAGLMIVLKTLSFNYTGIFLSHITPDTSFNFIDPILILLLTSACEPPSLVNSDPRYLKEVIVGSSGSTIFGGRISSKNLLVRRTSGFAKPLVRNEIHLSGGTQLHGIPVFYRMHWFNGTIQSEVSTTLKLSPRLSFIPIQLQVYILELLHSHFIKLQPRLDSKRNRC